MAAVKRTISETMAGTFVLLALVVLSATAVLVMRERHMFERRVPYRVLFRDAYGIQPGNPVTIAGIDVGRVESIRLDYRARVEVSFTILESYASRVRQNSLAEVKSPPGLGGIIGGTGIKISVGDPAVPEVLPGAIVASSDPFSFEDALALIKGGKALERGEEAIGNVESLLASIGSPTGPVQSVLRDVAAIVHDVRTGDGRAAQKVERILSEVHAVLQGVHTGVDGVNRILVDAEGAVGNVREATALTPETVTKVNALLDGIGEVLRTLALAMADVKKITGKTDGLADDVVKMVGQVDTQLRNLDEVMGALRKNILLRPYMVNPAGPQAIDPQRADTATSPGAPP